MKSLQKFCNTLFHLASFHFFDSLNYISNISPTYLYAKNAQQSWITTFYILRKIQHILHKYSLPSVVTSQPDLEVELSGFLNHYGFIMTPFRGWSLWSYRTFAIKMWNGRYDQILTQSVVKNAIYVYANRQLF